MQTNQKTIQEIAKDLDNLITDYLQKNEIKNFRINTNFHNVPVNLFDKNFNYHKRLSQDNKYYLVHTTEIQKFSFTFFSQNLD